MHLARSGVEKLSIAEWMFSIGLEPDIFARELNSDPLRQGAARSSDGDRIPIGIKRLYGCDAESDRNWEGAFSAIDRSTSYHLRKPTHRAVDRE